MGLTFSLIDLKHVATPHEDALVLELLVSRFQVCQILIDLGSFVDFLHVSAFK